MYGLSKKDREIIARVSEGTPDYMVCREFGLRPHQLEHVFQRLAKRAETYDAVENAALYYERVLRRRAENTVQSLAGRFHALLDGSPDAILVVNAQSGIIREANANAAALFGYPLDQLIGLSMEELVPERYRKIHPAYRIGFLTSARKREMGYHPPIFAVLADGKELEVAVALTASNVDDDVMVVCSKFEHWKAEAHARAQDSERT